MSEIQVTKTFLPPIEDFTAHLKSSWDRHWITNRGELVKELEKKLQQYLSCDFLTLTCNGTVPLQIAIKALGLKGEIITTPFSYVATASSIVWENCDPVFSDIDPLHLTIDENLIEDLITDNTSAILATHVFGNPCNIERIEKIANRHNLKVIYDAAHCFGVQYSGRSVFTFGDVSTCSFHATKIFHTGEGGAMFTSDKILHEKLYYHHNFGHKGQEAFQGLGINGKMPETAAALGLAVLPYMEEILGLRKRCVKQYMELLSDSGLQFLKIREDTEWNYSYFPVIFKSAAELEKTLFRLRKNRIFPRRYFYPSLTSLPYVRRQTSPVADGIAERILCLPLYHDLSDEDISKICELLIQSLK